MPELTRPAWPVGSPARKNRWTSCAGGFIAVERRSWLMTLQCAHD
jgi:hypothetical protein